MFINSEKLPPIEKLRAAIDYNPETGKLFWRVRQPDFCSNDNARTRFNRFHAGKEIGHLNADGYIKFQFWNCTIIAHRAAWAIYYGEWPAEQIDHINGQRDDNRITNLRSVSARVNSQNKAIPANNKSGHIGVFYCNTSKKWVAKLQGKRLGQFATSEMAINARQKAEGEAGFHPNHGRRVAKDSA